MIRQFYDVADRDDCLGDDSLCLELDAVSIIHAHRLQSRFITTEHFVMQAVISEQVLDNGDRLQEVIVLRYFRTVCGWNRCFLSPVFPVS